MYKKRILIISHALNKTGAPTALLQLLKRKPVNLEIEVVGMRYNDLENELQKFVDNIYVLNPNASRNIFIDAFQRINAIPKLLYILVKKKPDLILINSSANSRALLLSKLLKVFFKNKIVLYVHEFDEMFKHLIFLRKKTICLADILFVVSKDQINWIENELKCKKKFYLIPNAIDIKTIEKNILDEPEREFILFKKQFKFLIGYVGFITKRKGYDLFARIINKLKEKNIGIVIIGDFTSKKDKEIFFSMLKENKERIYLTGEINNIFKYLKYVDSVAITSRSETFSRVALESMAIGIPVISFKIKGLRQTFPKNYDYLVNPYNIDDFVKKILRLYSLREEEKESIRKFLKNHSKNFSLNNVSDKFWKNVMEILND